MTYYICCQCNENCIKSREDLIELGLDPDSDDDYDRLISCYRWGYLVMFEKIKEGRE